MEIIDVVRKLVGPIEPIGDIHVDVYTFENLKTMSELVNELLIDIDKVIPNKQRDEGSMKRAGEFADNFFLENGFVEFRERK